MSEKTTIIRNERGEAVIRKSVKIHDLMPRAHQFAEHLTKTPAEFSYEELCEEFKPDELINRSQGRVLLIFTDHSSLEFFYGSTTVVAHNSDDLDKVMASDSRLWNTAGSH